MLIRDTSGLLARVVPTTACTNSSGLAERRFLAERFHIETVVTSHDPRRPQFQREHRHSRVAAHMQAANRNRCSIGPVDPLRRVAQDALDVRGGYRGRGGRPDGEHREMDDRLRTTRAVRQRGRLAPVPVSRPGARRRCAAARTGKGPRAAARSISSRSRWARGFGMRSHPSTTTRGYRVFWGRSKDLRTTMEAVPEQNVTDRKETQAARYRSQAGHVLLAAMFATDSGRLLAIFSNIPALGSMWVPIQGKTTSLDEAKALCAWCNSTLGALGFLMRRGGS